MRILHSLSILIVFIFHTFYVFADLNEGYAFRSLDINNGLSQNTVHAIYVVWNEGWIRPI